VKDAALSWLREAFVGALLFAILKVNIDISNNFLSARDFERGTFAFPPANQEEAPSTRQFQSPKDGL
jgi:hypothetical protein